MNSFIKQIQLGVSTYDINVVDGAINTNQLAANAVVEGKIADGSVTASKIEDLSVTKDKISEALAEEIESKQDAISDLSTIRSNATAGKTASDNLGGHTVAANVPANAKFTDTIYDDTALKGRVTTIEGKIPAAATSSNQLADKAFVNSSISTSTAEFKGTVKSIADLKALEGDANDYAFYKHTTTEGNVVFDRYKWTSATSTETGHWLFEYSLNNSSFTAAQWSAINSGITSKEVTQISSIQDTLDEVADDVNSLKLDKQDKLTAGSNILINNTTGVISATDTTYGNATTSTSGLMSALDKFKLDGIAAGAKTGTVTSVAVKMNGETKGTITTSGTIDLGTVITAHQDISGKQDKSNLVTAWSQTLTDTKYPSEKLVKDSLDSKASNVALDELEDVVDDVVGAVNELGTNKQDKLTAGSNITISNNTISAKDTTYSNATTSTAGLMSSTDKAKLDGISSGAVSASVSGTTLILS